jgi:holo-[acyl-carrier protein] synthase
MIIGLGSDICNIQRIENALNKFGDKFVKRWFGANEQKELSAIQDNNKRFAASLAKRFAAKEAFAKAMGTGFVKGTAWAEIEVVHHTNGKPIIVVSGTTEKTLQNIVKEPKIWIGLSDDYPWAQAVVIIESR